jgi:hypothetical protein
MLPRRRKSALPRCGRGGIGRRAALRSLWGNPWKFESSRPHQKQTRFGGFFFFFQMVDCRRGEPSDRLPAFFSFMYGVWKRNGHVISWQRRDVNLPPDPILKLMAVAFWRSLYNILQRTQSYGSHLWHGKSRKRKKAGRNSHRPSSIRLDNNCQYIRGQPSETNSRTEYGA